VLGLNPLQAHHIRAEADRVADVRVLKLGEDIVCAVHVQTEQVLDPVVGVSAAARRGPDLQSEPSGNHLTPRVATTE
jgi:hypothetical protein